MHAHKIMDSPLKRDERREQMSLKENVSLIHEYINQNFTKDPYFGNRVKVTCAGIDRALEWVSCG